MVREEFVSWPETKFETERQGRPRARQTVVRTAENTQHWSYFTGLPPLATYCSITVGQVQKCSLTCSSMAVLPVQLEGETPPG